MPTERDLAKIYGMMERCNCDMATAMHKVYWIEKSNPEFITYIADEYIKKHKGE